MQNRPQRPRRQKSKVVFDSSLLKVINRIDLLINHNPPNFPEAEHLLLSLLPQHFLFLKSYQEIFNKLTLSESVLQFLYYINDKHTKLHL